MRRLQLCRTPPKILVALLLITSFCPNITAESIGEPSAKDRQITLTVRILMTRQHLTKHKLDDEISQRALVTFLKALDPMKLYFLQSDIDEFDAKKNDIDDMINDGKLEFAFTVFDRLMERMVESVTAANLMIDEKHDFTLDEYLSTDWDDLTYAADRAALDDRWRKRIKYNLLVLKGDETEGDEAQQRLHRRYNSLLKQMQQTKSDELLEMFLTAVTTSYDPHTTYMSPTTLENFEIQMRLNLDGIGAQLTLEDGYTNITKIIPGGAADLQGDLAVKDRIVSVGQGADGEMVDVIDMKLNDVVAKIRGKAGTTVRLGIIHDGSAETVEVIIVRAKIQLRDSEAKGKVIEHQLGADGKKYKVGIINLPSFYMDMEAARKGIKDYRSTTRDVRVIIDGFKKDGVDAIVMDLSTNGGGSLTEAIDLTGLFIDQGTVVQVKSPSGEVQQYDDRNPGTAWDGPLVVVCSKFSASASEIFAGAIADYDRGIVVGDSATHGKGTVQSLLELGSQLFRIANPPNLGALKITMQQFYRPSGESTQLRGVKSDVVLPSITDHMDVSESDLDYPVAFDEVDDTVKKSLGLRDAALIESLTAASAKRVAASEKFQELQKQIGKYNEQRKEKRITLNEEKYFAERKARDAEKETREALRDKVNGESEIFPTTFYNSEVLNITVEYIKQVAEKIKLAAK
ncbi:MAG: carboxy terminal-processing peptidase [Planctomycetaceae bacterium]|jgi:carboxyl-terminal processing protease|nr:carboxy terminal-processing peptidase [Planctomycetaceae bacterium]